MESMLAAVNLDSEPDHDHWHQADDHAAHNKRQCAVGARVGDVAESAIDGGCTLQESPVHPELQSQV